MHFIKEIRKRPKLLYLLLLKTQNISLVEISFFSLLIFNLLIVVFIPTFPITRIELILLNLFLLCLFFLFVFKSSLLTYKFLLLKTQQKVDAITIKEDGIIMHIKYEIIPIHKSLIAEIIATENFILFLTQGEIISVSYMGILIDKKQIDVDSLNKIIKEKIISYEFKLYKKNAIQKFVQLDFYLYFYV